MASFTTRVELVNPDKSDYDLLHQEMRDAQFYRAISYCGTWHDLPAGEYDRTSDQALNTVYTQALAAVQTVINNKPLNEQQQKKDFLLLITEVEGARAFIIPKTTDIAKLPPGATLS
ncbi:MAG TPA: hypothetical protein VK668_24135 [Mucilaginibacter sp.]|nr:hypothetical protein [Mucilaginibacter sp.]